MYFGKIKNTEDEWGFDVFESTFENSIEVSDKEHESFIERANAEGKRFKGDKEGKPILVDPPEPTKEELAKLKTIELQNYLRETDWYAIRFADTGEPIPEEIKKKRQEARDEVSKLKEDL